MTKKVKLNQYNLSELKFYQEELEDIELQEDIAKAQLSIAQAKLSKIRNEKRNIKKEIKETEEILESLEK